MPHKPTKKRKAAPKRILRLLDLDHAKRTVLNSLGSPDSARAYGFAIDDFIASGIVVSHAWPSASMSSCGTDLIWRHGTLRRPP
jgi:hypothetical protein